MGNKKHSNRMHTVCLTTIGALATRCQYRPMCNGFLRFTSATIPANLLVDSMVAELFFDPSTCTHAFNHWLGSFPGSSLPLASQCEKTDRRTRLLNKLCQLNLEPNLTHCCKGIATPRVSGNASVAAWNDSIDLYCVKHTEWQWQWHLKWHGKQQRSNRSQTHF